MPRRVRVGRCRSDGSDFRDRIVEVVADMGEGANERYQYGSGCIVAPNTVLTAAHVVRQAKSVRIRDRLKDSFPVDGAGNLLSAPDSSFDMAILHVPEERLAAFQPLTIARVDRSYPSPNVVRDCDAIGYPEFMEFRSAPGSEVVRDVVHVRGDIPIMSSSITGRLTLQVSAWPRPLPEGQLKLGRSEWSGMSGAPVFSKSRLIGVVTEHRIRQGASSISVSPLADLPSGEWWRRLGVRNPRRLRRLPWRISRRQAVVVATSSAVLLVAASAAGTLESWLRTRGTESGPGATPAFRTSVDWKDLGPDGPGAGLASYRTVFATSAAGWPVETNPSHALVYANGAYTLTTRVADPIVTVRSPVRTSGTKERISGSARIGGGAGSWGVWCRGSGIRDVNRYEFRISHSGAVEILEPGGRGTGWVKINGIDMSSPVTLTAHCDDSTTSDPVHLGLAVNGRRVIDYVPQGRLLGPGDTGLQAYTFGDVSSSPFSVSFVDFESSDS